MMEVNIGTYRTKIIEEDQVIYSTETPLAIIAESSTENGSAIGGRMETVKAILKTNSKLPSPISPYAGIYFFPTTSARNKKCVWFSYYQIKNYYRVRDKVAVLLYGGRIIIVNTSYNQFDLQYKKTSQIIAYYHRLLYVDRLIRL